MNLKIENALATYGTQSAFSVVVRDTESGAVFDAPVVVDHDGVLRLKLPVVGDDVH